MGDSSSHNDILEQKLASLLHARQKKSNGGEENLERKKHQRLAHPNKGNRYIMYVIDTKNGENFDQGGVKIRKRTNGKKEIGEVCTILIQGD